MMISIKEAFLHGDCNEFAYVLNDMTYLKIGIITETRDTGCIGRHGKILVEGLIHAFCVIGNELTEETMCVDANGVRSFRDILNDYTKNITTYSFEILENPSTVIEMFVSSGHFSDVDKKAREYIMTYILPELKEYLNVQ